MKNPFEKKRSFDTFDDMLAFTNARYGEKAMVGDEEFIYTRAERWRPLLSLDERVEQLELVVFALSELHGEEIEDLLEFARNRRGQ